MRDATTCGTSTTVESFSDEYDLVIEKTAEFYKVSWIVDGNVLALGVGMEVEEGLAVGWRRVAD